MPHGKANFPARSQLIGQRHQRSSFISLNLVLRSRQVRASHAFMRGFPMSGDRFDIHRHITDQIITMLDGATSDFHLPWHGAARDIVRPVNVASRNAYRGINILSLWAAAIEKGYSSGLWGTFKQWSEAGAQVRRGEKAAYIVFYKQVIAGAKETDDEGEASSQRFVARGTPVFAAEQVDGWTAPTQYPASASVMTPIEHAETFVAATGAVIIQSGSRAFYRPSTDSIHLPPHEAFIGTPTSSATEAYYATVFHELIHWTSHPNRCNRELGRRFGEAVYAMEELVAELGAAFLCADLHVASTPHPDHAHYLASWLAVLRQDKRAIFTAASKASEAAAFLNRFTKPAL